MDSWQYAALLGLCILATLPLEAVLGVRVYRHPRALAVTLPPVLAAFVAWDLIGFYRGDWSYNPRYTLGVRLLGLPVEEWLFFLVVPVCALLTFEVLSGRVSRPEGARARGRHDR